LERLRHLALVGNPDGVVVQPLQQGHIAPDGRCHVVECLGEGGDFVLALHGDLDVQVALAETFHRLA